VKLESIDDDLDEHKILLVKMADMREARQAFKQKVGVVINSYRNTLRNLSVYSDIH
jgi:hypothetical protein